MKYYLASNDLYVEMLASVFKQIQLQAEGEYPNENGGILVGRYSADRHTVYIEKIVVPMAKMTGRTMFVRNTKVMVKAFRLIGFCLCLLDSANSFRVRDTPFGSCACGCANLIKSGTKIAVKVGSGDKYACLSLFSGKMSLFNTR